jgi:hypothetical protein
MSHALSSAAPLACWDYSVEDQGPRTLFEIVGMMAHIPSCPTTLGRLVLLMSGLSPHSQ